MQHQKPFGFFPLTNPDILNPATIPTLATLARCKSSTIGRIPRFAPLFVEVTLTEAPLSRVGFMQPPEHYLRCEP